MKTFGYAALRCDTPLEPFTFDRREPRTHDVVMEVLYTGVCHSDLHQACNDWGFTQFRSCRGTRSSAASQLSAPA